MNCSSDDSSDDEREPQKQRTVILEKDWNKAIDNLIAKSKAKADGEASIKLNGQATYDPVEDFLVEFDSVIQGVAKHSKKTFLHSIISLSRGEGTPDRQPIEAEIIKPLFRKIVQKYPDLLTAVDSTGQTPLYCAISSPEEQAWALVDCILDFDNNASVKKSIDKALQTQNNNSSNTCLQLAIDKPVIAAVVKGLIKHASEQTLELLDNNGKNPFHCAVNWRKCTDERVELIELLLQKDEHIIKHGQRHKTFLDYTYVRQSSGSTSNKKSGRYSVYGEHMRSKRAAEKKAAKAAEKVAKATVDDEVQKQTKSIKNTDGKSTSITSRSKQGYGLVKAVKSTEDDGCGIIRNGLPELNEMGKVPLSKISEHGDLCPKPKGPKDQLNDGFGDKFRVPVNLSTSQTPPGLTLSRRGTFKNIAGNEETEAKRHQNETLERNSRKILEMLKLHYMRTRNVSQVISFLYGGDVQTEKHICFEYDKPKYIRDRRFLSTFKGSPNDGLRLDEVLLYAKFPYVEVERTGKNAEAPSLGRQDMVFFLDWLRGKGVRRIIKLEVDDFGARFHSDQVIQESLQGIVVEHLDWRKPDLDPRVICQVSRNAEELVPEYPQDGSLARKYSNSLRRLTLRWSGSNAVLRAWSEPEGLPQLPELDTIYLDCPAEADMIDSKEWVLDNINEFKRRLNQNFDAVWNIKDHCEASCPGPSLERKINVIDTWRPSEGADVSVSESTKSQATAQANNSHIQHEWLACADRFSDCMYEFWNETVRRSKDQGSDDIERLREPVVVALIDDGIDIFESAFSSRSIAGKSFDVTDDFNGGERLAPHFSSFRGHGTAMARLIWRVCPMAKIYSIRLKTHEGQEKGSNTINATSAALAIQAALDQQATLISMSWTIPEPQSPEEKEVLENVLNKACEKKVLMFCSVSDNIAQDKHYPSVGREAGFFRIGAARSDGTPWGHAKNFDFVFPGVKVASSREAQDATSVREKEVLLTGSSIATALAAGLGAMLIYCFKATALGIALYRPQQQTDHSIDLTRPHPLDAERITKTERLKKVFAKMGATDKEPFIPIWIKFQPVCKKFQKSQEYNDRLRGVIDLCVGLLD